MSEPEGERLRAPVSVAEVLAWLENTANAVRAGEVSADELIRLLGEFRRASAACADASDWLLLAAREEGASLRQIAPVFGKGYVRAPAARLEKLHRQALNSAQWLEILHRREQDV
ncbi:hypothetical protein [Amycolatopsis anabasis]|uniref:hypothetical protein n=1 Tax=Amycolatopsis anabasis TaxID=1840409 RepID=UPI00131BCBB6|nr:hypothetical protein [Amycolatopsis anabasis]